MYRHAESLPCNRLFQRQYRNPLGHLDYYAVLPDPLVLPMRHTRGEQLFDGNSMEPKPESLCIAMLVKDRTPPTSAGVTDLLRMTL